MGEMTKNNVIAAIKPALQDEEVQEDTAGGEENVVVMMDVSKLLAEGVHVNAPEGSDEDMREFSLEDLQQVFFIGMICGISMTKAGLTRPEADPNAGE